MCSFAYDSFRCLCLDQLPPRDMLPKRIGDPGARNKCWADYANLESCCPDAVGEVHIFALTGLVNRRLTERPVRVPDLPAHEHGLGGKGSQLMDGVSIGHVGYR